MNIGIFGLGYVGLTTAACLLRREHHVVGYEISEVKRNELASGRCPLTEPGVEEVLIAASQAGTFRVAADINAEDLPDIVLVCVGTPSAEDGSTDLTAVRGVFGRLAAVVAQQPAAGEMDVAIRSTLPPGTLARLEREFARVFARFPVVFYPEFLREGTAMSDFDHPPQTVLGQPPGRPQPQRLIRLLTELGLTPQLVEPLSAEALKMACNAFHAVKVCFGNEIGRIVNTFGGNATEVMELFVKDTALNISPRYLMPGTPYGGSCLPKDVRSISNVASRAGVSAEILAQCEISNASHLQYIVAEILKHQPTAVALLGLAFKRDTDDLRESPSLSLASALLAAGIRVVAHDFAIQPGRLTGANKVALEGLLRRTGMSFSPNPEAALSEGDLVVLMHRDKRYAKLLGKVPGVPVVNVAEWRLSTPSARADGELA